MVKPKSKVNSPPSNLLIFFAIALRNFSATNGYSIVLPPEINFKFCMHFIIVTFGIHFTFHRLISHKAFRTSTLIERLGTIVGCLAMSGSSIGWSGVHIHHHRYSDTELDPHPAS